MQGPVHDPGPARKSRGHFDRFLFMNNTTLPVDVDFRFFDSNNTEVHHSQKTAIQPGTGWADPDIDCCLEVVRFAGDAVAGGHSENYIYDKDPANNFIWEAELELIEGPPGTFRKGGTVQEAQLHPMPVN